MNCLLKEDTYEGVAVPYIKSIRVIGIHGRTNTRINFFEGLNIVHGPNGVGKTTLLHIIANLLERDLQRFCYLSFREIHVQMSSGCVIFLEQRGKGKEREVLISINDLMLETVRREGPIPASLIAALSPHLGGRPVYLPAFRTMLEGTMQGRDSRQYVQSEETRAQFEQIKTRENESLRAGRRSRFRYWWDPSESIAAKTVLCRQWFGSFVPIIRYPSLMDLAAEITNEFQSAVVELSEYDQEVFSSVFVKVCKSAFGEIDSNALPLEESIDLLRKSLPGPSESHSSAPAAYKQIAEFFEKAIPTPLPQYELLIQNIVEIYARVASERSQKQKSAFDILRRFEESVNKFLSQKSLNIKNHPFNPLRGDTSFIIFKDGSQHPLSVLSSGERHLITLLFCATHMSDQDGIVLIDEPELSLHIDWQRIILKELQRQSGDRQVIVCTHATEVAADHRESLVFLSRDDDPRNRKGVDELFSEIVDETES